MVSTFRSCIIPLRRRPPLVARLESAFPSLPFAPPFLPSNLIMSSKVMPNLSSVPLGALSSLEAGVCGCWLLVAPGVVEAFLAAAAEAGWLANVDVALAAAAAAFRAAPKAPLPGTCGACLCGAAPLLAGRGCCRCTCADLPPPTLLAALFPPARRAPPRARLLAPPSPPPPPPPAPFVLMISSKVLSNAPLIVMLRSTQNEGGLAWAVFASKPALPVPRRP